MQQQKNTTARIIVLFVSSKTGIIITVTLYEESCFGLFQSGFILQIVNDKKSFYT